MAGGFLHDVYGNYTIPFMIAFGNFVVSILMVWGIRFLKGSRDHAFK